MCSDCGVECVADMSDEEIDESFERHGEDDLGEETGWERAFALVGLKASDWP